MARRRKKYRKRPLLRPPAKLPTVFSCPNCGANALTVTIDKKSVNEEGLVKAVIRCGKCGLYAEMWVPKIYHPVDVYSKFLDKYLEGEIEYRFIKRGGGEEEIGIEELLQGGGEIEGGESREGVEEESGEQ